MNYYICSISFRHELVSFPSLMRFASRSGYSGIELWGVHGLALLRHRPRDIVRYRAEMSEHGLDVAMISDYVDLNAGEERFPEEKRKWSELLRLAGAFGAGKLRIFAGRGGSGEASPSDWEKVAARLRLLAEAASAQGIQVLVETHPGTYADRLDSTLRLMADAAHPNLGINLDFMHLWETGTSPEAAWTALKRYARHFHLKNVRDSGSLPQFAPENVYSPSGTRSGLVSLGEGLIDYSQAITRLIGDGTDHQASLEWFGDAPFQYLRREIRWLKELEAKGVLSEAR